MSETTQQARNRRELRKAKRAAATAQADNEEQKSAEDLAKVKQNAVKKSVAVAERKTRREQRDEQRAETAQRADVLERITPEPFVVDDPRVYRGSGNRVPLHVMNALANQNARHARDRARDIAKAAGKAAYGAAQGHRTDATDPHVRSVRMRDALASMDKAKAAAGGEQKSD